MSLSAPPRVADRGITVHVNAGAPLPGRAWRELLEVKRFRHLVRYLVRTSIRSEHAGTTFGFLWWVLDPLMLMAVYVVLVDVILRRGAPDYPVFVLSAVIPWTFFTSATRSSIADTIRKEQSMRQVAFPKAVIPLAASLAEGFHFLFGLAILVVFAIPFGIMPHPIIFLVVPIAFIQFVFTLGFGYFLSALNVLFRDTHRFVGYVFRIWFYLSPAIYPLEAVPVQYRDLYMLNPFATFFPAYRKIIMEHAVPDLIALGIVGAGTVMIVLVGYLFFVRSEPLFAKLV